MKTFSLLILMFLLATIACQPVRHMQIDELKLPPDAKAGEIDGQYEIILDGATSEIFKELSRTTGKPVEKILFLPPDTNSDQILQFFAAQLSESGFTLDEQVPVNNRHYKLNIWRSGSQAVAVAVIDAGQDAAGQPIKFLLISLATRS